MGKDQQQVLDWFRANQRPLPWRQNRDPYKIWISEIMLQQTTVAAVIPFYENFMQRFPSVQALADAPLAAILEAWSGLGYYSRARNLHKAAKTLAVTGFPKSHQELLKLPGFGPYTARAVSSIAFEEKVGVLDGNVIRVLSRRFGIASDWWKPKARQHMQLLADQLAQLDSPSQLNQALMELGATVCTPANPACLLCPWSRTCVARKKDQISALPRKRPRRQREIWLWKPLVIRDQGRLALVTNDYAPFLRGQLIWPGQAVRTEKAPSTYCYKHSVTHHDIFVVVETANKSTLKNHQNRIRWIDQKELRQWVPASLVYKALSLLPADLSQQSPARLVPKKTKSRDLSKSQQLRARQRNLLPG